MYIGLDLSAAFDIIDYQFLFEMLLKTNGLQYVVFIFIKSYPSNCSRELLWMDVFLVMLKLRRVCNNGRFLVLYFFPDTCCL